MLATKEWLIGINFGTVPADILLYERKCPNTLETLFIAGPLLGGHDYEAHLKVVYTFL